MPPACQQGQNECPGRPPAFRHAEVPRERGMAIAAAFFAASRSGDKGRLYALLAADVRIYADGGTRSRRR